MNRCPTIGNALCVCVPNTLWLNLSQPKCSNCYLHRHQDFHQDKGKDPLFPWGWEGIISILKDKQRGDQILYSRFPVFSRSLHSQRHKIMCSMADENNQRDTSMPKRFWRLRGLFVGRFWGIWSSQGSMDGREQGWVVWFKLQAGKTEGIAETYTT